MADTTSASVSGSTGPGSPRFSSEERLPKWVLVSLLVHLAVILSLLVAPFGTSNKRQPPRSYVVDLVGGERIGGRNLGTQIEPEIKTKPRAPESAPAIPAPKKETKAEKAPTPEKTEKVKTKLPEEIPPVKNKSASKPEEQKKEAVQKPAKETTKETVNAEESSLDKVRERVMQAAIERARNRAASASQSSTGAEPKKAEPLSAGNAEGIGAQSLGKGGTGGEGVLKSVEFIAYQNRLVNTIKANWAWAGHKSDLKVVVQFGIKENGEVAGLKVTQRSGDPTYDESVLRAIRRSSPFSPPPESHRKEFADVEMTFKPSDFGA
jgi:TonB family protein